MFRNTGANAFAKNQTRLAYEDKRDLYCKSVSVQYEQLKYSGPTTLAPEYQFLLHINHIKSCPSYWHHTFIYLTSPFSYHLYSETSHRPFHISSILISTIYKHVRSVQEPRPNSPRHEVALSSSGRYIRRPYPPPCANQKASSWRGCLTSHITPRANMINNTSAHDIPTSNIILRRKYIIPCDITVQNPYLLHI